MSNITTETEMLKARIPHHFAVREALLLAAYVNENFGPRGEALCCLMLNHKDAAIRRKAAWAMNKIAESAVGLPSCVRWEELEKAIMEENDTDSGLKRLLLGILLMLPIPDIFPVNFYDWCLEHAFLPQEKPATQALCLKHVRRFCDLQPELLQEVRTILADFNADLYSPALKSVVRRWEKREMVH